MFDNLIDNINIGLKNNRFYKTKTKNIRQYKVNIADYIFIHHNNKIVNGGCYLMDSGIKYKSKTLYIEQK